MDENPSLLFARCSNIRSSYSSVTSSLSYKTAVDWDKDGDTISFTSIPISEESTSRPPSPKKLESEENFVPKIIEEPKSIIIKTPSPPPNDNRKLLCCFPCLNKDKYTKDILAGDSERELKTGLERIRADIRNISGEYCRITGELLEIYATQDTSTNLKLIHDIFGQQQRIKATSMSLDQVMEPMVNSGNNNGLNCNGDSGMVNHGYEETHL